MQVANAIEADATVSCMAIPDENNRRDRLQALANKIGGKAALGRALGYKDGAFVGQMLRGERPITEKTVSTIEAIPAYAGWFSSTEIVTIHTKVKKTDEIVIPQFETGGAMGAGLVLRDQPGVIQSWHVSPEWIQKNVKSHTGVQNLCIVTGFGDSMRGMFNSGDPLIVDAGVKTCELDAVYFFRVDNEGFIKRLQRIPGEGIRVISSNKEYESWTIKQGMSFEVFGRVLKVWQSEDF